MALLLLPLRYGSSTKFKDSKTEVTLTFSQSDLSQLEAFAALHGEPVAVFVQRAALEAAGAAPAKSSTKNRKNGAGALWLTDGFSDAPDAKDEPALFTVADAAVFARKEPESVAPAPTTVAPTQRRGVAGEQSRLAKGHEPVWEVRRALGRERVHGLGWTREQLAFVLKLSVVGVRKMEHMGTSPVKSLEARQKLLGLAKTLAQPGAEIAAYIEREENTLG